ncbi:hypothetical protein FOA52_003964 [Chlamydomonas sp. UWO 241]|nr:hypothetical protein FOA52_003964 [Chlamydomonas sp. UWO 241]
MLRQELSREVENYKTLQGEIQRYITTHSQLQSQVNENEMVLEELTRLSDDANVFKMIGPALVRQDLVEAKSNVNKRIEYIKGEINRMDTNIKIAQGKAKERESEIMAKQGKLEKLEGKVEA